MKICIIGGGWYGCHLSRKLSVAGHEITVIEKNGELFNGISGKFGIRLHAGPHYPRSLKTRESCRRDFNKFIREYESLVVPHEYSFYALGDLDVFNLPPKVDLKKFKSVCAETKLISETEYPDNWGFQHLQYIANIYEPSIAVGDRLQKGFKDYLRGHDIQFIFNTFVTKLTFNKNKVAVHNRNKKIGIFDRVINTTSYQFKRILSNVNKLPFQPKFQTCLGLIYKDKLAKSCRPFSFIVMDGFFPCLMPYADNSNCTKVDKYIITHGQWTILGTFDDVNEARFLLNSLTPDNIQFLKNKCEDEMNKFWPTFKDRFEYCTWKGEVLVKLLTEVEFRSAVTYADNPNLIHVIPGKVSNIFDVEEEVFKLIDFNSLDVIKENGYFYVRGGVLDDAISEIKEKPQENDIRNTCSLQTYLHFKKDFVCAFNH